MTESTFHALLIGADGYFPNQLSSGAHYPSLHGCVEDVRRVEAMLRARLAPVSLVVTALVAPAGPRGEPTGDPSSWPTAANIRRALADVTERAQPGDQVYIHYSGHGGRVHTAWPALKGHDGLDEALVPIDIGLADAPGQPIFTRPERYIRDVDLAFELDRLASKRQGDRRITVTLVFDACHSGGATRGAGKIARRSAVGGSLGDAAASIDRRKLDPVASDSAEVQAARIAAYDRLMSSATRSIAAGTTSWLPPSQGYVLLAACRDVESALECSIDGKPGGGVLTGALLEALDGLGREQSGKTVYDRVLARVHSLFASQTPQLVGEIDRHVFGVALQPIAHTLTVARIDPETRTVTIHGGLALAITEGTQLGIYEAGVTDFSRIEHRVALLTIRDADALASRGIVDATVDLARLQLGAPAVVNALPLRRRVELLTRHDLPADVAATQSAALAAVAAAITRDAHGFLESAPPGETPHYQVALTPQGRFELCDPQGAPFSSLEPVIAVGEPHAATAVVAQLRRLGRYHTVLEMSEPASSIEGQLRVELLVAPPGWTDRQPAAAVGGTPLARIADAYTVQTDTWLWLRLTNQEPGIPLNVALLNLGRTWEIEMIVPHPGELAGRRYETIAGQARTFAFRMYTPVPEAIDLLKLFIAVGDVDFRALTTTGTRTPDAGERGTSHALGRMIDAINATETRTRAVAPARSPSAPWTVQELRMRTLQRMP
jgi:hypothetical protein